MILDELVLHNVGVFSGYQKLSLNPVEANRPVVLIGGLNGTGKTTIRDALYLVLYGSLAQGSFRRGSYEAYLKSLISRGTPSHEGAAVELAFHTHREGLSHSYRVRRSWRLSSSGATREQLVVLKDGRNDQALTATWPEQVEAILPRGIAGLFFFDGEKIEAMADLERSREVLSSAMASLLGLDLVDRLDTDLAVIRSRHRAKGLPDQLRQRLAGAQAAATAARQAEEAQALALAQARVTLERASKEHFKAAELYRSAGGELLEERHQIDQRLTELREQLSHMDREFKEAAAGPVPLLIVSDQLASLAAQAEEEESGARDRLLLDVLDQRDRTLLDRLKTGRAPTSTISELESFLSEDRERRRANAAVELVTGLRGPEGPAYLVNRVLPDTRRQLVQLINRREELLTRVEEAERLVATIPDQEALLPLQQERDTAFNDVLRAQAALAHAEDQHASLRSERERAEASYEKVLDETTVTSFAVEDDRRIVDHVDRVRSTLRSFKEAATNRHVGRISNLVLESLSCLLRKENLVREIGIDPETFAVELRGPTGVPIEAEVLSAGERQLLAVALLWGLARAAGQPLPVVIDTPLGRLDSGHRQHLVDRYFPQASHQVVLLSTDTEIDREALKQLRNYVGRTYRLEFDPSSGFSTVVAGYFWED